MTWMETDYSKHAHIRWKVKWRLEHLGTLGTMDEITFFRAEAKSDHNSFFVLFYEFSPVQVVSI